MPDVIPDFQGDVGKVEATPVINFYADSNLANAPVGSTNGTALDTIAARPQGATAVEIFLPTGASITYTIATAQPDSAPAATNTVSAADIAWFSVALGQNTGIYVTASSGGVTFRWL